ncbi:MAG: hypothetical protein Q4C70_03575 [Planctomycetia bacterium]|nr:hypothetical protein [Planctomycetia bacterium]
MNPNQIRTLKPGQMPKASEWNALVRSAQAMNPRHNGYTTPTGHADKRENIHVRKSTLFYTESAIPAYSIFAVKTPDFEISATSQPFLLAEVYDNSYRNAFFNADFGTNGNVSIPSNSLFYGYIISEHYDDIVEVSDLEEGATACGFASGSYSASGNATGLRITDHFNGSLYYVRRNFEVPSEVFGTLSDDWQTGDESAIIQLDDDFRIDGTETLECFPAPTLPETLDAGTAVTCRYIKSKEKWFFFRPSGSASETRILTISGGTLEGFYADELGDSDYEPQAKKISIFSTLSAVACMATREDVNAVGSDSEKNWIQFINQAVDGVDDCEFPPHFIRGDYAQYSYGTSNRIFLRSDCNWQKVSSDTTLPMLQFIGNHYDGSVYSERNFDGTVYEHGITNCLFFDINNQLGYGILGEIHSQEDINRGATYTQRENKPCYLFNENSQMYEGINGAEGSFQFGRPEWRLFDSEQNFISEFIRSWKRTENGWIYEGIMGRWFYNVDSDYKFYSYRDIRIETVGNISYLRLGTQNRENQGWFETVLNASDLKKDGDSIGDVIVESQMFTLSFTVTPRENIEVSAWDILTDSIEQGIGKIREDSTSTERGLVFYIKETDVTRWEIEKSETDEISITFQFVPGSETEEEPKPDKVYTISQIIQKDYDADGEPHFTGNEFTIGTYGDSAGYWKCDETTLEGISIVFQFAPLEQEDLTLEFYQMNTQPKKEKIWVFVPQVLTD